MAGFVSSARAGTLVGRDAEIATLVALLGDVPIRGRRLAFIEGEAGIGKSRMLATVLERAATDGFHILLGTGREFEQDRPFGVVGSALGIDPTSAPAGGDPRESRVGIIDTMLDAIEQWCTRGPTVLALEDLHWADSSSLLALGHLVTRLADQPLALIGTFRPHPHTPELDRVIAEFSALGATRMTLAPLDAAATRTIAREVLGADPDAALRQSLSSAGGNPLFVIELAAAMIEDGSIRIEGGTARSVTLEAPPSLHVTILRRLGFIPSDVLDILRMATILGSSFSVADLATILERPVADLTAPLGVAIHAGVLGEDGDRLAFRHDLVRDALYTDQPLAIRKALHWQAGRRLSEVGAPSGQIATQFAIGSSPGDADAIHWLRTAARDLGTHAPAPAAEFLKRALELMAPTGHERDVTLADLAVALTWAGRLEEARHYARGVLARTDDGTRAAALHSTLAKGWIWHGRPEQSIEELEKALARPDLADGDRALLLGELALRLMHPRDIGASLAAAREAEDIAVRSGNRTAGVTAAYAQAVALEYAGRFREAVDMAEKGMLLAEGGPSGESPLAEFYLAQSLIGADRFDEATAALDSLRRNRLERRQTGMLANAGAVQAGQLLFQGRWDEALVIGEESVALSADTQFRALLIRVIGVLAVIAVHRDDLARAEQLLAEAERDIAISGPGRWGLTWLMRAHALLAEARGDRDEALGILGGAWDLCAMLGSIGEQRDIAPELARLAAAAGDRERLRAMADGMEHVAAIGGVPTARGAALLCRGVCDQDPSLVRGAVEVYRASPRPVDRAIACELAAPVVRTKTPGEAVELLHEALAIYEEVGARRDIARVDASLRSAGTRKVVRQPRRRATTGWESLTPGEREVVKLVAVGLRNTQIAARLYVSRRTVETHLTHVFAKLGLSSRVQLTAEFLRRGEAAAGTERR